MIAIPLLAALLVGAPQDSSSNAAPAPPPAVVAASRQLTPEQQEQIKQKIEQMRASREPQRKAAIRINDLAANIHSEADARKLVDAVAEELTHHHHLLWAAEKYRHRVAHAEYEAVSDPSGLIPEQRIVDVWNEYVREIDAPESALITKAELHNLRDSTYFIASSLQWKRDFSQSIWSMPNIYALGPDGKVADGCRALEALKLVHDMHELFPNLLAARQRVQKGIVASDHVNLPATDTKPVTRVSATIATFHSGAEQNPVRPAAWRYQREHGDHAYDQLVRRLFDELFPPEK